jgi:N-acetylglucosaminyldiphosphoundecaprenol N-acetyl-beta-D-mannosaminyltransferase
MSEVFGINFSPLDMKALIGVFTEAPVPGGAGTRLVVTANVDHVVNLVRNERFRAAYRAAWVATADGAPVALYARLRGAPIPGRVSGADLFPALMRALSPGRHRPYFLVSRPATGERLREWLVARGFDAQSVGIECPPFGFERDLTFSADLARRIREHGTTHLVLGVGAPKSEVWVHDWHAELGDCYAFAVGAGVDFFVGNERRAPVWMQHCGLEWVWRFAREPRRLFRRYFVDSWMFPVAIKNDMLSNWRMRSRPERLPV